jgi:hypothetical protein
MNLGERIWADGGGSTLRNAADTKMDRSMPEIISERWFRTGLRQIGMTGSFLIVKTGAGGEWERVAESVNLSKSNR